jgi:SAM-dependent methyltransferase
LQSTGKLLRAVRWFIERAQLVGRQALGVERRLRTLERGAGLDELAARTVEGRPNPSYLSRRIRDHELVAADVKTLGYELARTLAERLPEPAASPLAVPLTSRLCIQADLDSAWLAFWRRELRFPPHYHRKLWEWCFIAQALFNAGKLREGCAGLGFGCGEEKLPSLFVKYGASVLATDQAPDAAAHHGWVASREHAASVEKIRMRDICDDSEKLARIDLRHVDMNAIPADFAGRFDFCWSACAAEHLGTIANGLAFIENSLRTLKPGGVAVHSVEYNLADGVETIDNWPTVLFQKKHIVGLVERLTRAGYRVAELDFTLGTRPLDSFVDVPPWSSEAAAWDGQWAHLKLSVDGFACTSFALIIQTPEAGVAS